MPLTVDGLHDDPGQGRYRVLDTLERSPNNVWYKAFDEREGRTVALKVPLLSHAESRHRYFTAVSRAAGCHHPNVLSLLDIAETFTVHEFFPSRTLDTVIRSNGRLSPPQTIDIALAACRGLDHAHRTGLVHGDFRPHNVLIDEAGDKLKIRDFGTSREEMEGSGVTRPGDLLGSLYYIAPEQIRGESLDRRVDIYALGLMLFEMLTGDVPYRAEKVGALLQLHLTAAPRSPGDVGVPTPAPLDEVILRCLQRDPRDRYQTVEEVVLALQPR